MGVNKKIALFNVTNLVDTNPGCHATVEGLKTLISGEIIFQFPLGYCYSYFNSREKFWKDSFKENVKKLGEDLELKRLLNVIDVVIINCEGTIHSNSIGAKTLLAIASIAKFYGKKVFLVNGSFANLDKKFLKIIKSFENSIFTRERNSQKYLAKMGISTDLVFDCAFLTDHKKHYEIKKSYLYTPGVLFSHGGWDQKSLYQTLEMHFQSLRNSNSSPCFLLIEENELVLANKWKDFGGEVIDSRNLSLTELLNTIGSFETVVSGRYHILLFAIMVNRYTVPLESNSHKIAGLYNNFKSSGIEVQKSKLCNINLGSAVKLNLDLKLIQDNIREKYGNLFQLNE